jgi:predicted site-specific integrase-resolvase
MANAKTYRPEDVAATLGISGKVLRAYLRKTYPRPASAKGSTWVLSQKQTTDTVAYFKKRNPEAYAAAQKKRAKRTAPKKVATVTPKPEASA